jgi:hypothetical protein
VGGGKPAPDHTPATHGHGPSPAGGSILDHPHRAGKPPALELEGSAVCLGGQPE